MKKIKYILLFIILSTPVFSQQEEYKLGRLSNKILFVNSQSLNLRPNSSKVLDTISKILKQDTFIYKISSHSSMSGKSELNLKKTQKRAELIKRELVKRGVKEDRLIPIGYGETERIYMTPTRAGDIKNERVLIIKITDK